jgi:hypothetical protein
VAQCSADREVDLDNSDRVWVVREVLVGPEDLDRVVPGGQADLDRAAPDRVALAAVSKKAP